VSSTPAFPAAIQTAAFTHNLLGTFNVSHGSSVVLTSDDQSGILTPGVSVIVFNLDATQTQYAVANVDQTQITLGTNYTGTSHTATTSFPTNVAGTFDFPSTPIMAGTAITTSLSQVAILEPGASIVFSSDPSRRTRWPQSQSGLRQPSH
jgi:hypothetical protein